VSAANAADTKPNLLYFVSDDHGWKDVGYVHGPMEVVGSQFLLTVKDYPPSQAPGDWSLDSLEKQITYKPE